MALGIVLKAASGKYARDPQRAVACLLIELLTSCSRCGSGFSIHDFALLATCILRGEKDDTLLRFFEAIKDNDWAKLRDFQSWLGNADNVEAYAIRCSRRLSLAVVKTHFELLESPQLLYTEDLSADESAKLLGVFADRQWHQF